MFKTYLFIENLLTYWINTYLLTRSEYCSNFFIVNK